MASIAVSLVMTKGAPYPIPYHPIDEIQAYCVRFTEVMRIASFLQFGASILGLFAATVVSRLQFHRVTVAGVQIALFGGLSASLFLAVSSLGTWVLSQSGIAIEAGAMRTVELLAFATGGFGNVAATGLLLAEVSVPALFWKLMPSWACWFVLVVAGIAEVSTISIVFPSLSVLLAVARFASLIWVLTAGFTMPKNRRVITPAV